VSGACTRSRIHVSPCVRFRCVTCVESLPPDSSHLQGYGATILAFGPFSALYFMIYEQLKEQARSLRVGSSAPLTPLHFVACAAIAGGTAAPPPPTHTHTLVIFVFQVVPAS
jgi:hypothetical protein